MEERLKLLTDELGENRVKQDVDLLEYFQTGLRGKVKAFYIATTTRELIKAITLCRQLKIPFYLLGSGSKTVFSQDMVQEVVIKNRGSFLKIFGVKGKVSKEGIGVEEALLETNSGVSLKKLVDFGREQNLAGLEDLGQTGTVGGSYLSSSVLQEKAVQVKVLTEAGNQTVRFSGKLLKGDIILSLILKLKTKQKADGV